MNSKDAQQACVLHEKWIRHYWQTYSKEAHMGLVELYVMDERFTHYYEQIHKGLALFIRDAMQVYLKFGDIL